MREAFGERTHRRTEGKAAEDALTPLRKAREKGLQVVGGDALDHSVAVVQNERLDVGDVDGLVVERRHTVGGDEEEVGALGKQPVFGQRGGTRSGPLAEAREGARKLGGLAVPRAEDQADRRTVAPFEPVQQGRAVADQRAAARPGPAHEVVAARDDGDRRRLEGRGCFDALGRQCRDGFGAEGKFFEGCHRGGVYAGSPEPGPPASPYS